MPAGEHGATALAESQTLAAAQLRMYHDVLEKRSALRRVKHTVEELGAVEGVVSALPNEDGVEVMVPLGSRALIPGRLVSTDKLLVLLGDNYFAEKSRADTCAVLQRRRTRALHHRSEIEADLDHLEKRINLLRSELDTAAGTIRHPVGPDDVRRYRSISRAEAEDAVAAARRAAEPTDPQHSAGVLSLLDQLEAEEQAQGVGTPANPLLGPTGELIVDEPKPVVRSDLSGAKKPAASTSSVSASAAAPALVSQRVISEGGLTPSIPTTTTVSGAASASASASAPAASGGAVGAASSLVQPAPGVTMRPPVSQPGVVASRVVERAPTPVATQDRSFSTSSTRTAGNAGRMSRFKAARLQKQ